MSGLLNRNTAVLAKIESVYGTDPVPTGAANAILVSEATPRPMDMKTVDRALLRPFFGSSEQLPSQIYNGVEFTVELAGSGAAGTAPAYGPLLRACGFSETIDPGVSVIYAPVTTGFESVTMYINIDGVLHKSLGARGTVALSLRNNDRPTLRFNMTGLYVPVIDAALPTADFSAWQKPLPVNFTNTPTFTLHGYAGVLEDLQIDLGNQVVYRALVGGSEQVRITERGVTGSIVMEAEKVADKDWWASIRAATTGALALVHGLAAGNIVTIGSPGVQVHTPSYSDSEGIAMLSASLAMPPSATGNDELTLTFT